VVSSPLPVGMKALPWLMGEKHANWEKHRTEVTEGELVSLADDPGRQSVGAKPLPWLMGEKHGNWGKHRTEVTEGRIGKPCRRSRATIRVYPFLISVTVGDAFSGSRVSLPSATVSPKPLAHNASSPLCDLRDLCAMLSPNSRFSRP
jgi:hypothetical protein